MRLIDADKLKVMCETVHDITPKLIIFDRMMVSYENIDLLPTVEAIPIKWLKKEYLDGMGLAGCMPRSEVVREIIERWEKENEGI